MGDAIVNAVPVNVLVRPSERWLPDPEADQASGLPRTDRFESKYSSSVFLPGSAARRSRVKGPARSELRGGWVLPFALWHTSRSAAQQMRKPAEF